MAVHGNLERYIIKPNPDAKDRFILWDTVLGETVQVAVSAFTTESFSLQDNIRRVLVTFNQTEAYNIWDLINNSQFLGFDGDYDFEEPIMVVSETETVIVKVPRTASNGNTKAFYFDYYFLINTGKGTYGATGDTLVDASNFEFWKTTENGQVSSNQALPPIVYDIYTLQDIEIPQNCLNNAIGNFETTNDRDYFFKIFPQRPAALKDTPFALYRWVGDEGLYGQGNTISVSGDFELVNLNEQEFNGIKVRKIVVPAIINGSGVVNDDIAKALNRSFRGILNIENNEIVLFEAYRKVGNSLVLEKYYWKAGKAQNITAYATANHFEIDYKEIGKFVALPAPSVNAQTKIFSVVSSSITTPHTGANLNEDPLDFDVENFDIYVFSRSYDDTVAGEYNLYKYTGAALTYGVGSGNTAVIGDFLLIDNFGDNENPPSTIKEDIIKVRKIVIGAIINGTGIPDDDISKAVNRSFRGQITIQENEILLFEVQRLKSTASKYELVSEKYYWKGSKRTIVSDSVLADFEIDYESKVIASLGTGQSEPTQVEPLYGSDVNTPEVWVNASDETYVIAEDQDYYFIVYNENVNSDEYKVYKYVGAVQTIGNGGVTVVNADFEEVGVVEDINEDTGWQDCTLGSGGITGGSIQVKRISGTLVIKGVVELTSTENNLVLCTLPVGFRPDTERRKASGYLGSAASIGVIISTNGEVVLPFNDVSSYHIDIELIQNIN